MNVNVLHVKICTLVLIHFETQEVPTQLLLFQKMQQPFSIIKSNARNNKFIFISFIVQNCTDIAVKRI